MRIVEDMIFTPSLRPNLPMGENFFYEQPGIKDFFDTLLNNDYITWSIIECAFIPRGIFNGKMREV